MQQLMHQSLQQTPYKTYWLQSLVVTAWATFCPGIDKALKKIYIKEKKIFVQFNSAILAYNLHREKKAVMQRLKEQIAQRGVRADFFQDIIFL